MANGSSRSALPAMTRQPVRAATSASAPSARSETATTARPAGGTEWTVRRGHDDLSLHALVIPAYWMLMSAAAYMALVDLFLRPYHWHKTEHGLHLAEEAT